MAVVDLRMSGGERRQIDSRKLANRERPAGLRRLLHREIHFSRLPYFFDSVGGVVGAFVAVGLAGGLVGAG